MHGLRINPGNIGGEEQGGGGGGGGEATRRAHPGGGERRLAATRDPGAPRAPHGRRPWWRAPCEEIEVLEKHGFYDIKISVKASSVPLTVAAYRLLSEAVDYPLHVGVSEAGPLLERHHPLGRGHRRPAGRGHRGHHPRLPRRRPGGGSARGAGHPESPGAVAPRAGHRGLSQPAPARVSTWQPLPRAGAAPGRTCKAPLRIAVMGCAVNGPGEAREADLGSGRGAEPGPALPRRAAGGMVRQRRTS